MIVCVLLFNVGIGLMVVGRPLFVFDGLLFVVVVFFVGCNSLRSVGCSLFVWCLLCAVVCCVLCVVCCPLFVVCGLFILLTIILVCVVVCWWWCVVVCCCSVVFRVSWFVVCFGCSVCCVLVVYGSLCVVSGYLLVV